jgi:predicted phosphodiesterase
MVLHNPKTIAIMTGDQQEDSKDTSWQPEYFLSERNILKNTVIYNVLGNHDAAGIETFDKYFDPPVSSNSAGSSTKTYYSFNYGDVHFVILDGNQSRAVGSEQYKWLVADMASTNAQKADWRIIFTHQPGLSYGGNHGLGDDNGFMNAISALDTAPGVNKNADLIIMGHNHVYERAYRPEGEKRGITWITDGTVGGTPGTPPLSGEYLQYAGPQGYGYIVITASHKNISGTYYYTGDTGDAGVTPIVKDEFIIPIFHGNNQPNFWDRVVNFLKDLVKL